MQTTTEIQPISGTLFFDFGKETEQPSVRKWTKSEYHKLAELGFFEGFRTEFIAGEIIEMPTMNSPHATGLTLTQTTLQNIFNQGFAVRGQMPIDFGEDYEPVPDIVIVKGNVRDFLGSHPKFAELIVEVSDTTLNYDRNRKLSLYAKHNIADYWIVNLRDNRLEVYRRPIKDATTFYGFGYAERLIFVENNEVSPLANLDAKIKVSDLLP